jgi:hypothetical protein
MISDYNVVICVLIEGEYGVISIIIIARDILYNFYNIRIGLMVGISGSTLSLKHDICFSNIMVSAPCNRNSSIF